MPGIIGNLALINEYEETISCILGFDDEMESQSESREGHQYYIQTKYNPIISGKDPSSLEQDLPICAVVIGSYNSTDWWYAPVNRPSYLALSNGYSDTEAEKSYAYSLNCGRTDLTLPERNEPQWLEFCESLFPKCREHTAEERDAYSEFIDSFFEEIEI